MKSQKKFEDNTYETVQTILGEGCPSLDVLRKPTLTITGRGRGRKYRFVGLSEEQRERIKSPSATNGTTPLINLGLRLVAYHHRDCRLGFFEGPFEDYVRCHLHESHAWNSHSTETAAGLYGLDPVMVARASDIYRMPPAGNIRRRLTAAFADGSIRDEIAHHQKYLALIEAYRGAC